MKFHKHIYEDKEEVLSLERKHDYLIIEFSDTIFYPGGGGQPHDTGILENNNFKGEVVEVFKQGKKILHKVKVKNGLLKKGDKVILKINKKNRDKIVRMHTGEHIFYKSLEKAIPSLKLKKIDLDLDESSLYVNSKKLTWDNIFKAESLANSIIEKDLPIIEHHMKKEDAVRLGKLRIKPERIKSDNIRIIEVKDFDWSACMGCHAETTGFVGNILVTNYHQTKGGYEIKFKVNVKKDLYDLADTARKTASMLNTNNEKVTQIIQKMIDESAEYKEKFREVSAMLLDNHNKEKIKDIDFFYAIVDDVEKKQLIDKSNELLKEKTLVCFVSKKEEKSIVILNRSDDLKIDISELLKRVLGKFNGKGGGRDNFAMGSFDKGNEKAFLDLLKQQLNNSIS